MKIKILNLSSKMKLYTPEYITELKDNEIFVFGSNKLGIHGSGSAKTAIDYFGAIWGKGVGLMGKSYAFPTVSKPGKQYRLSNQELNEQMEFFLNVVLENPFKTFYLTKIGTNRAGISIEEMKSIFWNHYIPDLHRNVIYPFEFENENYKIVEEFKNNILALFQKPVNKTLLFYIDTEIIKINKIFPIQLQRVFDLVEDVDVVITSKLEKEEINKILKPFNLKLGHFDFIDKEREINPLFLPRRLNQRKID